MLALYEKFPTLAQRLPRAPLLEGPTPVVAADSSALPKGLELYVKDDGRSGPFYGGNKVRKLEFLLGLALRKKKPEVATFGAAGSNHALATAIYAKTQGLGCTNLLMFQPNARYVRKNLLASQAVGARLHHYLSRPGLALGAFGRLSWRMILTGKYPQVIPVGGSSPLGTIGFVNAGFELAAQVEAGLLPAPKRVYVAMGSAGTSVGLAIGLAAAGLETQVHAVRVVDKKFTSQAKCERLLDRTIHLLQWVDWRFPKIHFKQARFHIQEGFLGEGYARFTPEGLRAMEVMDQAAGIRLEPTYTAKAFSALLADAPVDGPVLFWNTANTRDLSSLIQNVDYKDLPRGFHPYFTEPVQDESI